MSQMIENDENDEDANDVDDDGDLDNAIVDVHDADMGTIKRSMLRSMGIYLSPWKEIAYIFGANTSSSE